MKVIHTKVTVSNIKVTVPIIGNENNPLKMYNWNYYLLNFENIELSQRLIQSNHIKSIYVYITIN